MPSNVVVRVKATSPALLQGLEEIAKQLELPGEFPADVTSAAERAATDVVLPELDRTDLPFITIDPAGSMDLDQALHIERAGDGFVVHYAIADVAAFVKPGDPIDLEAHRRGETLYGAGTRIPLHPPALSEGAASLLPDQTAPALLWTIDVDGAGTPTKVHVERALVRSTARLSYVEAQAALDDGSAGEVLLLLKEVGLLRQQQELDRGGISLPLPEQEIDETPDGFELSFRKQLPVEEWNAQISLLTGISAASLMVGAKVGMLRTLPPADPRDVARLRRVAHGLRIDWPKSMDYPAFIRSLDPAKSAHQAMVVACTRLLRGSGYAAFDGELPEQTLHSAIAAEYAHVTAPLRRLGDRYAGEVCLAICAGEPVPQWVTDALPGLPKTLQDSARRAGSYERSVLDLLEAAVLSGRVGEKFDGVITSLRDDDPKTGVVLLADVGVEAPVTAQHALPLGEEVEATLATADLVARKVAFTVG
ncbi:MULTISPECIES: RNB domain-containing ribonuclease [unclassified Nocardioides]|uniref:RNB domain-containing ribonuclease n=1 Tax=unclassified Nocardioides TaxID=2615069 RepID=UPI0006F4F041|nr:MULTISPECIES: RNB domain-containing ribonuclease [unclassified Nocardioides]KRA32360.1 ribonuclease II [Nocardioides sp. Root614]KRA89012.1 ribonuclease II [Nocardioides sp. Root682]